MTDKVIKEQIKKYKNALLDGMSEKQISEFTAAVYDSQGVSIERIFFRAYINTFQTLAIIAARSGHDNVSTEDYNDVILSLALNTKLLEDRIEKQQLEIERLYKQLAEHLICCKEETQ